MAASYGKASKAKATKLHSQLVRQRSDYKCEWCGVDGSSGKQIQCAHIISRAVSATRTDERNAVALCASCHWKQSKNPLLWARWIESYLGKDHLDDLIERGVSGVSVNWDAEVERLQNTIDLMNQS